MRKDPPAVAVDGIRDQIKLKLKIEQEVQAAKQLQALAARDSDGNWLIDQVQLTNEQAENTTALQSEGLHSDDIVVVFGNSINDMVKQLGKYYETMDE